jgi:hypothetical protein
MFKPTDPDLEPIFGLRLTLGELGQLERSRERAALCATAWRLWWRVERGLGVPREELLLCPRRCGLRSCPECGARLRARHQGRTGHAWASLLLLTVPHRRADAAEAWRSIHAQLARFIRLLRQAHRGGMVGSPGSSFEYAWALEAHRDGFPHVHMVCSIGDLAWSFLRGLWRAAHGSWCYVGVEGVRDGTAAKDYLAKYVAKGVQSDAILALLYRRRLWARSRGVGPALVVERQGWEDMGSPGAYPNELLRPTGDGWRAAWEARSGAALHWRYSDGCRTWLGDVQGAREEVLRRSAAACGGLMPEPDPSGWVPPWRSRAPPLPPISRLTGPATDRQTLLFVVLDRDSTTWR